MRVEVTEKKYLLIFDPKHYVHDLFNESRFFWKCPKNW